MAEQLVRRRVIAWLIDGLIVLGLGNLFDGLGWLAAGGYWLLRDGLFEGQSVGKRLMDLKAIVKPRRTRCTFKASIIRNVLWVVPVINLAMALTGLYYLTKDPHGRHWGDRLADTQVVAA